ncbi:PH domain-containing protein [Aureimonas flava]|uniref:PH domain-containing protein n=1 Tax=Aureimonas flava TaxID=2320271 RepID=A0A3A1WLC1_9HYPH|nr:PH domain-containing protein [Aureimonas flava]RIY00980.1 PH domain-containing protein [Aureimonas flava]
MGLLSGLLGLASDLDTGALARELEPVLLPDETIEVAFQIVRDQMAFTDRRVILVDKQGMTGRKRAYHSIPYRAITMFSVETAGSFDADAELRIWVSGQSQPFLQNLSRGTNLAGIQKALASGTLGRG